MAGTTGNGTGPSAAAAAAAAAPGPHLQQQQQEEEDVDVPYLSTIAPAIFVPAAARDFTQPPPPLPVDPGARLDRALARIDEHGAMVQRNIRLLLRREARRNQLRARQLQELAERQRQQKQQPQPPPSPTPGLPPSAWSRGGTTTTTATSVEYVPGGGGGNPENLPLDEREWAHLFPADGAGPQQQRPRPPPPGLYEVPNRPIETPHIPTDNEVDEARLPPRTVASRYFLNMVPWGLGQLEQHAASVRAQREAKRAEVLAAGAAAAAAVPAAGRGMGMGNGQGQGQGQGRPYPYMGRR
ncbi:hypothetical protein GGR56DRAFT_14544 [Xylariaceae sp. FL0804]|nr:hypothetical protein GGR56DRAFT_14544 [Xylariaceae sp. FL0804]